MRLRRGLQQAAVVIAVEHQTQGLGGAVAADDGSSGGFVPASAHARGQALAGRYEMAYSEPGQLLRNPALQYLAVERGDAKHQARAVLAHHLQHPLGVRPMPVQNHGRASAQAGKQAVAQRVGKEQFRAGVKTICRAQAEESVGKRIGLQRDTLCMHHALGDAGGAGGADPQRRRFFVLQHGFHFRRFAEPVCPGRFTWATFNQCRRQWHAGQQWRERRHAVGFAPDEADFALLQNRLQFAR